MLAFVPVKKVEIEAEPDAECLRELRKDLVGKILHITLTNGREIVVELFERRPGKLSIRSIPSVLEIYPRVANMIDIAVSGD